MKPYKLASIYLDLDHVQGVDERPKQGQSSFRQYSWFGHVYMAFQDKPLLVELGLHDLDQAEPWKCPAKVTATWGAFLTAWKNRDGHPLQGTVRWEPRGRHTGPHERTP